LCGMDELSSRSGPASETVNGCTRKKFIFLNGRSYSNSPVRCVCSV
jgi:hypothetical protein